MVVNCLYLEDTCLQRSIFLLSQNLILVVNCRVLSSHLPQKVIFCFQPLSKISIVNRTALNNYLPSKVIFTQILWQFGLYKVLHLLDKILKTCLEWLNWLLKGVQKNIVFHGFVEVSLYSDIPKYDNGLIQIQTKSQSIVQIQPCKGYSFSETLLLHECFCHYSCSTLKITEHYKLSWRWF